MSSSSRSLLLSLLPVLACALFSLPAVTCQYTQGSFGFFGAGNNQYDFSHCLDGSGSGSLFVTGSTDGTLLGQSTVGSGGYDLFVLKYDKNNGFLTKNTNNPLLRFNYTTGYDEGHSCVSDTTGAVYVAGMTNGNMFASPCGRDTVVLKYDNNLNFLWGVQIDAGKACADDWAVKVLLYGSQLYVVGQSQRSSYWTPYIFTLNTADGSQGWSTPIYYGAPTSTSVGVRDAAVDSNGNVVLVGSFAYAAIPASHSLNGSVIPSIPLLGNPTGYVAGFDSLGNLRWQLGNGAGASSVMYTVTTDVTGAVYAGGFADGSVRGASYQPNTQGNALPLMQKLDTNGNVLWTVLYPQYDSHFIVKAVTDNIGGVYWLDGWYTCYSYQGDNYYTIPNLDSSYSCSATTTVQFINLFKTDVNGNVQSVTALSNGIAQSLTIDNTGLLTLSGDIGAGVTLHGAAALVSGYSGFIDQQLIAYNCSCNNLASLAAQMSTLLNITSS